MVTTSPSSMARLPRVPTGSSFTGWTKTPTTVVSESAGLVPTAVSVTRSSKLTSGGRSCSAETWSRVRRSFWSAVKVPPTSRAVPPSLRIASPVAGRLRTSISSWLGSVSASLTARGTGTPVAPSSRVIDPEISGAEFTGTMFRGTAVAATVPPAPSLRETSKLSAVVALPSWT